MNITISLTKLQCSLTDLRTGQEEEQDIVIDTDDYEEAENRTRKYFEKLGYKVNAIHMADNIEKKWNAETLWQELLEKEIKERAHLKCEKCRNRNSLSNVLETVCASCVRKNLYEPLNIASVPKIE